MTKIVSKRDLSIEEIEELLSITPTHQWNKDLIIDDDRIEIDFEGLAQIIYEHHIYEEMDSSNKIDILHTIRNANDDWIEIEEIVNEHPDLNKSTVYRNIKKLREAGLVEQIGSDRSGMYQYDGPLK